MSIRAKDSIILVGCKKCGKSTLGAMVAENFNMEFYDTDIIMEKMTGMPLKQLYDKKGVSGYMQVEEAVCKKLAENFEEKRIVIAAGSGICDNAPAINALSSLGVFVFLKQDIDEVVKDFTSTVVFDESGKLVDAPSYIMEKKPKNMAKVKEIIKERVEERYRHYESIAEIVVGIKNAPKEENIKIILEAL